LQASQPRTAGAANGLPSDKRILIVEDESQFRFSLGLVLRQNGFLVVEAGDGVEAMAVLQRFSREQQRIDLVITDIKMPRMNGLELMETLHRRGLHFDFVVMTGHDYGEYARRARALGCRGILDKPFEADQLLQTVGMVLNGKAGKVSSATPDID